MKKIFYHTMSVSSLMLALVDLVREKAGAETTFAIGLLFLILAKLHERKT